MNFNERLIDLRKSKGLSQEELGEKIEVSRQTISKWELGQSYPDFQRLVVLSDYYDITLDELVKGISVQDVREKGVSEKQLSEIYDDVKKVESFIPVAKSAFTGFAIFGLVSAGVFLLMGIFLS